MRVIGVCFGHQIVGRALGVEVGRSEGDWEVSVTDVELTEKGREVFGKEKLVRIVTPISFPIPPSVHGLMHMNGNRQSTKCTATQSCTSHPPPPI